MVDGKPDVVKVAPPLATGSVASTVVPLRNWIVPVGGADGAGDAVVVMVSAKVTEVPVNWGLVGVAVRVDTVGAPGGGGIGNVPWRAKVRLFPVLPA